MPKRFSWTSVVIWVMSAAIGVAAAWGFMLALNGFDAGAFLNGADQSGIFAMGTSAAYRAVVTTAAGGVMGAASAYGLCQILDAWRSARSRW